MHYKFSNCFVLVSLSTSDLVMKIQDAGNVGISDHWGEPKQFSSDCLVTENQKSIANAAIF